MMCAVLRQMGRNCLTSSTCRAFDVSLQCTTEPIFIGLIFLLSLLDHIHYYSRLILRTSHKTRKLLQAVRLSALPHPQPNYISAQVLSLAICVSVCYHDVHELIEPSDSVLCFIPILTILVFKYALSLTQAICVSVFYHDVHKLVLLIAVPCDICVAPATTMQIYVLRESLSCIRSSVTVSGESIT